MSNDGHYLFMYLSSYEEPKELQEDLDYLVTKYGGRCSVKRIGWNIFCWDKPKHKLPGDDLRKIKATSIFAHFGDGIFGEIDND